VNLNPESALTLKVKVTWSDQSEEQEGSRTRKGSSPRKLWSAKWTTTYRRSSICWPMWQPTRTDCWGGIHTQSRPIGATLEACYCILICVFRILRIFKYWYHEKRGSGQWLDYRKPCFTSFLCLYCKFTWWYRGEMQKNTNDKCMNSFIDKWNLWYLLFLLVDDLFLCFVLFQMRLRYSCKNDIELFWKPVKGITFGLLRNIILIVFMLL